MKRRSLPRPMARILLLPAAMLLVPLAVLNL